MNFFNWLYYTLVYQPQLNLLELFYRITNDLGLAIVLVAIIVNVLLWPIFARSYVNMQKTRLLQPKLKELQNKYKEEPQKLFQETGKFYKEHGIDNKATFIVLIGQIFFVSGLFFLIQDATSKEHITGLYQFIFGTEKAEFSKYAFGFIDVGASATTYPFFPLISTFFSYIYGMYTFRWSPQPQLPQLKTDSKEKTPEALQAETMQRTQEWMGIYFTPIMLLFVQASSPTGLNIYFTITSLLSIFRQLFVTRFYARHADKLLEDIAKSDPESRDNNKDNNLENTAKPEQIEDQPQITLVENKSEDKDKFLSKNQKKSAAIKLAKKKKK